MRVTADRAASRFLVMPDGYDDIVAGEPGSSAAAILALTSHPDPLIDRLVRDEPSVLRDHLLERGEPVDPLLRALAGDTVPIVDRLPDGPEMRDELMDLWERVIALDPHLGAYTLAELGLRRTRYRDHVTS